MILFVEELDASRLDRTVERAVTRKAPVRERHTVFRLHVHRVAAELHRAAMDFASRQSQCADRSVKRVGDGSVVRVELLVRSDDEHASVGGEVQFVIRDSVRIAAAQRDRSGVDELPRADDAACGAERQGGDEAENERQTFHANDVNTSRTRRSPSSISRGDTAPTERRNHPSSRLVPNSWNGTTAKVARSWSRRLILSFVAMPPRPMRSNCTER